MSARFTEGWKQSTLERLTEAAERHSRSSSNEMYEAHMASIHIVFWIAVIGLIASVIIVIITS